MENPAKKLIWKHQIFFCVKKQFFLWGVKKSKFSAKEDAFRISEVIYFA